MSGKHCEENSRNRVAVVLEGGIVQAVVADRLGEIEVVVIDYDADGCDESEIARITQPDGSTSDAWVYDCMTERPRISLDEVFAERPDDTVRGRDAASPGKEGT